MPFLTLGFSQNTPVYYTKAQVQALLREDPFRAANPHYVYEVPQIKDTKAPRGYKPFYVSHYGRHGCRYHAVSTPFEKSLGYLLKLDSLDMLTTEGKQVMEEVKFMQEKQSGMDGMLTQKGAATHSGIAARLANRYPGIFSQKNRNKVRAVSSTFERCIMSMSNFILSLERNSSGLDISMDTGQRYMDYLLHSPDSIPNEDRLLYLCDSVFQAQFNPSRMSSILFKDASALQTNFPGKEYDFFNTLLYTYEIGKCLDYEAPELFSKLTPDELYAYWAATNIKTVGYFGRTVENKGVPCQVIGNPILRDILDKAEEAMNEGNVCADFRFGHDSALVPFLFQIRIDGYDQNFSALESVHKWLAFNGIPMASNVQFVFYKNKKGNVLVKVLVNEEERTFPDLKTVNGVYYEWPVLKNYLESILI